MSSSKQLDVKRFLKLTDGRKIRIDSRVVKIGDVFIALKGTRVDGNDFIDDALKRGAIFGVSNRSSDNPAVFFHPDPKKLLIETAAFILKHSKIKHKIAITGSNGKTTTKEILASILSDYGKVFKTPGNLNTEIGIPIAVLENRSQLAECDYAIFEFGTSKKGDISFLTDLINPDIAVLLNVGTAHRGNFNDETELLQEKCSIFETLQKDSTAITNGDDKRIRSMISELSCKKLFFGQRNGDLKIMKFDYSKNNTFVAFKAFGEMKMAKLKGIWNSGQLLDFGAAYLTALSLKIEEPLLNINRIILPFNNRFSVENIAGIILINDCYNSSLESVESAIKSIAKLKKERTFAVVGSILEQGKYSKKTHEELGRLLNFFDHIVLYTKDTQVEAVQNTANIDFKSSNPEEVAEWLKKNCRYGDLVYFKASRGVALEEAILSFRRRLQSGE